MSLLMSALLFISCLSFSLSLSQSGHGCEEALAAALGNQASVRSNLRVDSLETSLSALTALVIELKHTMDDLKLSFNSWTEGPAAKCMLLIGGGGVLFSSVLIIVFRNPEKAGMIWGIAVGTVGFKITGTGAEQQHRS
jgi:hypothetical protein